MLSQSLSGWAVFGLCTRLTFCTKAEWQGFGLWSQERTVFHLFHSTRRLTVLKSLVTRLKDLHKAVWESLESADQAGRLLSLECFGLLHGLFRDSTLHFLKNDKRFEWNALESVLLHNLSAAAHVLQLLGIKLLFTCKMSDQPGTVER